MQIYACDAGHYSFPADELLDRCPDCGQIAVRLATEDEENEYYRIWSEIEEEIKSLTAC